VYIIALVGYFVLQAFSLLSPGLSLPASVHTTPRRTVPAIPTHAEIRA
jgi:hypothetical protein